MNNECDHCGENLVEVFVGKFNQYGKKLACKNCYNMQYSLQCKTYKFKYPSVENQLECKYCPRIEDLHWNEETNDQLRKDQACFRCGFWLEKIRMKDDPCLIRVDGSCYHISEEPKKPQMFGLGFGGSEFIIDCFDGRKLVSHNLWHNGKIPKHFKEQLPDNARFVNESN